MNTKQGECVFGVCDAGHNLAVNRHATFLPNRIAASDYLFHPYYGLNPLYIQSFAD